MKLLHVMSYVFIFCFSPLTLSHCSKIVQPSTTEFYTINLQTPQDLQELFKPTGEQLPLLSAHRGGVGPDWPENCIETFEQTLRHTWAMLEIDLQYTKDSVLVLNHDATLDRTTNGTGRVLDFTLAELRPLRLKDLDGNLTEYRMPTLDEAMEWARGKTILELDKKNIPIKDAVRKIEEHSAESYVIVLAGSFEEIVECYTLNRNIMMRIKMDSSERFDGFDKTSVPWSNIITFVWHEQTPDAGRCQRIHAKGASTMAGCNRTIDRRFLKGLVTEMHILKPDYQVQLDLGVDVIETDLPREVGPLLYGGLKIPSFKAEFFTRGRL